MLRCLVSGEQGGLSEESWDGEKALRQCSQREEARGAYWGRFSGRSILGVEVVQKKPVQAAVPGAGQQLQGDPLPASVCENERLCMDAHT